MTEKSTEQILKEVPDASPVASWIILEKENEEMKKQIKMTAEVLENFLLNNERMNCNAKCLSGFNELAVVLELLKGNHEL